MPPWAMRRTTRKRSARTCPGATGSSMLWGCSVPDMIASIPTYFTRFRSVSISGRDTVAGEPKRSTSALGRSCPTNTSRGSVFIGLLLKHAVPIGMRADVMIVGQVLENRAAHDERINSALDAVEDFALRAEQDGVGDAAGPVGAERGDAVRGIIEIEE